MGSGGPFYGRCHRTVLGYGCREAQGQGLSFLRNPTVTCRRGRATVIHRYTESR